MIRLIAGGLETAAPPSTLTIPQPGVLPCQPAHRHLDRGGFRAGIARRHQTLADLEMVMVAACETAAARGAVRDVRIDDRATWDRATWRRYLDAAIQLEPEYGPRMRRLLQEIDQLERLINLPIVA